MWISAAMHRRTVVLPQPYGLKSIVIPVAGTESTRRGSHAPSSCSDPGEALLDQD